MITLSAYTTFQFHIGMINPFSTLKVIYPLYIYFNSTLVWLILVPNKNSEMIALFQFHIGMINPDDFFANLLSCCYFNSTLVWLIPINSANCFWVRFYFNSTLVWLILTYTRLRITIDTYFNSTLVWLIQKHMFYI